MWDYSTPFNAFAVEQWYTTWSSEEERGLFCLSITPYGISLWIDLKTLEEDLDEQYADDSRPQEEKDQAKEKQMEIYRGWVYPINVLEIEKISANDYHALVYVVVPLAYRLYEGHAGYRKIRLRDSDFFVNGLDADLAYIPVANLGDLTSVTDDFDL